MPKNWLAGELQYEGDLFGPTRQDYHWQGREGTGFQASQFVVDWQHECATCPEGHTSHSWTPAQDRRGNPVIKIKFALQDCRSCPSREQCTRSQSTAPRRVLTVRPQAQYLALQAARHRQSSEAFKTEYAVRAGIEGTLSTSASELSNYVRRATQDKTKSISSRFSSPPHSISAECMPGRLRNHERKHGKRRSCTSPRKAP